MKLLRNLGCGALLVALTVLGWFLWWCRVPLQDPAALAAIRASVEQRQSRTAGLNGYDDLRALWGSQQDPKDRRLVDDVHALPELWTSGKLDDAQVLAANPAATRRALKAFAEVYPRIKAALAKPDFAWPLDLKFDPQAPRAHEPDWLAFRCIGMSLGMASSWYAQHGQTGKALEHSLLAVDLAGRLSGQELLGQMMAVGIVNIVIRPLLQQVNQGRLAPGEYRKVVAALEKAPLKPGDFARTTDVEYVRSEGIIESMGIGMPFSLPIVGRAYLRRERNLNANFYVQSRRELLRLQPPPRPSFSQWDLVVGIATMTAQNYRAVNSWKVALLRLQAVRALAELEVIHATNGRYPDTYLLKDAVPGTTWSYSRAGKSFRLTCAAAGLDPRMNPEFQDGRWEVKPLERLN